MTFSTCHFPRDDKGTVAVLAAGGIAVLSLFGAASLTYSNMTSTRTTYQKAIDGAVLAGALLPSSASEADRIRAALDTFKGIAGAKAALPADTAPVFRVTAPGGRMQVEGSLEAPVEHVFGSLLGERKFKVAVAAAAQKAASAPVCLYALNGKDQGAIDLNGKVSVSSTCPAQANSTSSSGVRAVGNSLMTTPVLATAGGYRGENFRPAPEVNSPRIPDPLAGLPFPAMGPCIDAEDRLRGANVTLSPGTYCGGIGIKSGSTVRLQPGIYVMKDGELKIDSGSRVTGEEVVIAFTGKQAKFWMTGGAQMELTSPKTGPYKNIQFMEDRGSSDVNNTWVSIGGDSRLKFDGTMYFPNSNIWIFGGSVVEVNSPSIAMIGDKLWFQDNSVITVTQENPRNIAVADAPRLEAGARLVE